MPKEVITETMINSYVEYINLLAESNISDEAFDELMGMTFANTSEDLIMEVSAALVKRAAQNSLANRKDLADSKPRDIIDAANVNKRKERYERAKTIASLGNPRNSSHTYREGGSVPAHDIKHYAKTAGSLGNEVKVENSEPEETAKDVVNKVDSQKIASKPTTPAAKPANTKPATPAATPATPAAKPVEAPSSGESTAEQEKPKRGKKPVSKPEVKVEQPEATEGTSSEKPSKKGTRKKPEQPEATATPDSEKAAKKGKSKPKKDVKKEPEQPEATATPDSEKVAKKGKSKPATKADSETSKSNNNSSRLEELNGQLKELTNNYKANHHLSAMDRDENTPLWQKYVAEKKKIRDQIAALKKESANEAYSSAIALIASMNISEATFLEVINELKINKEECDKAVNARYKGFVKALANHRRAEDAGTDKTETYDKVTDAANKYVKLLNFVDKRYNKPPKPEQKSDKEVLEPKGDFKFNFKKVL